MPRGSRQTATPRPATTAAHSGGAGACQTGQVAHHSRNTISQPSTACASAAIGHHGMTAASSASGVTMKLTTGIATALASGETSENCWKTSSSTGSEASVAAHWTTPQTPDALTPAAGLADHRRADIEQRPDRPERQPEARRQHRPRVDQQDDEQRECQGTAGRDDPPRTHRQRGDRQHVQRALRRHREAGEQDVEQRGQAPGQQGRALRRQTQRQRRYAPPDKAGEQTEQRRHHGHVEPGDRHQMRRAGAVEGRPQIALDRPLITDDQRDENAGPRVMFSRQHGGERIAHAQAQTLDHVLRPPHHLSQALRRILAHVAGRPDVAFEQPGFVVETVRDWRCRAGASGAPSSASARRGAAAGARIPRRHAGPGTTTA